MVYRSADQVETRRREKQRSSWQQRIVRMGRTSAGAARPTGALPAVQQRLRRTKTAYKVDGISESFAVREKHSPESVTCQSRCTLQRQLGHSTAQGVQLATPSEYIRIINISPIDFSMNVVANYSGTKILPFMRKNFTLKFYHSIVSDIGLHKTGRNIH